MARQAAFALLLPTLTALLGSALLTGCSHSDNSQTPPRPALVVKPQPMTTRFAVYPGEVHAREESALSFRVSGKLANPGFVNNAPPEVVEGEKRKLAEMEEERTKLTQLKARLESVMG